MEKNLIVSPKYINLILTSVILIMSIIFIFSPLDRATYKYVWEPQIQGPEINLPLADSKISSLYIEIPCNVLDNQTEDWLVEFLYSSALQVNIDAEFIGLTVGHVTESRVKNFQFERSVSASADCIESISYSRELNQISYKSGTVHVVRAVNNNWAFEISGVAIWNSKYDSKNVKVEIVSEPLWAIKPSFIKSLLGFLLIILFLLYIYQGNLLPKKIIKFNINTVDIFVILSIAILAIISLPDFDDGWYLSIAKQLKEVGFYNNYSTPNTRPTGYLYVLLLSKLLNFQTSLIGPKLIAVTSLIISWFILSKVIFPKINSQISSKTHLLISSLIFIGLSSGFLLVIRPEPMLVLLLALSLSLIVSSNEKNILLTVFWLIFIAGFAIALHPAGLVIAFSILPLILYQIFVNFHKVISTTVVSGGFGLALIFFQSSPGWLGQATAGYTQGLDSSSNEARYVDGSFFTEWLRVYHLLSDVSSPAQVFTGLLLAFFPILFINKFFQILRTKSQLSIHLLIFSVYSSYLGLFFLEIKWSMYYSVLLPGFMTILLLHVPKKILVTPQNNLFAISRILIFLIFFGFSVQYSLRCDFDICSFDERLFDNPAANFYLNNFIYFVSLIILFLIFIIRFNRALKVPVEILFLCTLILLTLALPATAAYRDLVNKNTGWSLYRQNIFGTWNSEAYCGIFSDYFYEKEYINLKNKVKPESKLITMPNLYYADSCNDLIQIRQGLWDDPNIGLGWVPIYSLGKLGNNATFEVLGCANIVRQNISDVPTNNFCTWSWETKIKQRPKIYETWSKF